MVNVQTTPERHSETIVRRATEIPESAADQLWHLYASNYEKTTRSKFLSDLARKDWVVMARSTGDQRTIGFSTLMVFDAFVSGERVRIAYSGDTIVDPEHWGQTRIMQAWVGLMESIRQLAAPTRMYWFLTTKGFRTYMFLPLFFRRYHPQPLAPSATFEEKVIDVAGRLMYPDEFDPETGLIHHNIPDGVLRGWLKDVPEHRRSNRHVRHFLDRNPGYVDGTELACAAEFAETNFTVAGRRLLAAANRSA